MFKHIFLALDDSAGAHRALEEALRLAVSMQAAVTAVCVVVHAARLVDVDAGFPDAEPDLPPGVELATAVLAEARARFAAAGVAGEVRAVDAYGEEVAAVLLRTAAESEADLIVMGTHGLHGWRRLLAGSVAESLLRGADRPVLMLHADERAALAADAVAARAGRQPERRA